MKFALRALALAAGLALAGASHAQFGFTMRDANVRAGPARDYPRVAWLPVGTVVHIVGCLPGWRWCDVAAGDVRGFVYAGFLAFPQGDGFAVVRDAGPWLGLPLVGFELTTYWSTWYYAQPWYVDRHRWAHRHPPPGHATPRPPVQPPPVPPIGAVPPLGNPVPPLRFGAPPAPRQAPPPAHERSPRPDPGRPPGPR
jgi:uncharacterized protein YraI